MIKYFYYGIGYLLLMATLSFLGYGLYELWQTGYSLPLVLLTLYAFNLIFSIALFVQKRHSQAKVSWFLIMVLFPIIGHATFVIFGQRYKHRKNLKEYRSKETFKEEIITENSSFILKKQSNISGRGIYGANIKLFGNVNKAYEELFSDLKKAKKSINMHFYIIKPGEIFEEFKSVIIAKAKQGIKVRLIIDDFGRWGMPWYLIKELENYGVEVAIFGKVHFPFIASSNGYRTHRKLAIIDDVIVHTGGINIADEYASLSKDFGLWIDYNVRISGPAVRSYNLLFIDDWKLTTNKELDIKEVILADLEEKTTSELVMVESSPEVTTPLFKDSLISLILNARESIEIVTPYLVPPTEVISALRSAALSGVKISLFIPGKPDKKSVWIGTRTFAKELMEYGVKIYEFNNILVHSKFGIFDKEYAYFGTANIDMRSFYSQFEITNVVSGKIVKDLENLVKDYKVMSKVLKPEDLKVSKMKARLINIFITLFSPLM